MKLFKVRYMGSSKELLIEASTMKEAKRLFHEAQGAEKPMVYVESYIKASRA